MAGLRERLLRLRNSEATSAKLKFHKRGRFEQLDTLCEPASRSRQTQVRWSPELPSRAAQRSCSAP